MLDDQNVFRFDLNESLYFEKGQEVSEMIGISIDPEISIQSFDEYVSIRGVIELVGEYKLVDPKDKEDEEGLSLDDDHSKRYIETVERTDNDQAYFSHRFPVEISVPSYRIADINDVTVHIESFDYEMPDESQLIITSQIDIYGIQEDTKASRAFKDENESDQEQVNDAEEGMLDETFEFDLTEVTEEDHDVQNEPATMDHNLEQLEMEEQEIDEPKTIDKEEKKDDPEEDRWLFKKKTQTLEEFFGKESEETDQEEEKAETEYEETEEEYSDTNLHDDVELEVQQHEKEEEQETEDSVTYDEEKYEESDEDDYDVDDRDDEVKDVHYLADLFREGEEDEEPEQYTKMRLCIVQPEDTLEEIAHRYDVTTMQLLKRNDMEDDHLAEGQLLYIPSKSNPIDFD